MVELSQTSLATSIAHAAGIHAGVLLAAAAAVIIGHAHPDLRIAGYIAALILIARQQRALENLVHDASHGNWYRTSASWNDLAANLLVAYPVFHEVREFRDAHQRHHGNFGTAVDPCRNRLRMRASGKSSPSRWLTIARTLAAAPRSTFTYYSELVYRSPSIFLKAAAWHACILLAPLSLMLGLVPALEIWLAFWLAPMVLVLPFIRAIAEAEEHIYDETGRSELMATYTNLGLVQRLLIHPAGDWAHVAHHLHRQVPAWKMHRLHAHLMRWSPEYRSAPQRRSVLEHA
jgi:fatty acid desaturase